MKKSLLLAAGCLLAASTLFGQNASDIVIPITVTTNNNPPSIKLNFPSPTGSLNTLIGKKQINDINYNIYVLAGSTTTFTDNNVVPGVGYEYMVIKQMNAAPNPRTGIVYAGIEAPTYTYRGKFILVIDNTLSTPLAMELDRLVQDMRGDGYQVIRHDIDVAASSVPSVKALLRSDYQADSNRTVGAFLIGNIPVPYSGEINPDGYSDHIGAWPTDYYYGDMNEAAWTDNTVNNTTAARAANHNVPGDGKFDQSQTPTLPELIVSRLDFSNLSGWDVSQTELYRRYLNKNHAFRTGAYKPDDKTLVDDNLGYAGGEAFAQNGFRNGYAMTGSNSVVQGDFFTDTDDKSYLFGHGCGLGNYQGAAGVGSSANFQTDSVNVVFSMLYGSYFGDWDFETNPFMPSALASKGGVLTCVWAGRPNFFFHHMALGEPISTSMYWAYLNSFLTNPAYFPVNYGYDLIHVGMLGDPTLRAHAVRPPETAVAIASCDDITLSWKESADADLGYLIYRAPSPDSIFQLVVNAPVDNTTWTDTMPLTGKNYYQIKAFKLQTVPTGSYYNQSIGTPAFADFSAGPIAATASSFNVSCNGGSNGAINVSVSGGMSFTYQWSNGATTANLSGLVAGTYTVTVTNPLGCTTTASATVSEPPALNTGTSTANVSCNGLSNGTIGLTVNGGTPPYQYNWSNGSTEQNLSGLSAGTYTVTVVDANTCTKTASATITQPTALAVNLTPVNAPCNGANSGSIALNASGGTPGYSYLWSNGATTANLSNTGAGTYMVIVTDANGCTQTGSATVEEPTAIELSTTATNAGCAGATNGAIDLNISGGTPGYTFLWSNNATTQNLDNIAAGVYTVTATDNAGCTKTATATVGQVTTLVATTVTTDVTCPGGSDGSAMVTATGGDPGYTYLWSNAQTIAAISNLVSGVYTVTVTDNAGCTQATTAVVGAPPALQLSSGTTNISCFGGANGAIDLNASGGTPPYTYAWSNGAATGDLSGISAGTYTVTLTDAHGCTALHSATLTQPPSLSASSKLTQISCPGETPTLGSLSLIVNGGTAPYTYLWSNGATTANLATVPLGTYTVTLTDANGCTLVHTNTVIDVPLPWVVNSTPAAARCFGSSDGSVTLNVSGGNGPSFTFAWSNGAATQNLSNVPAGTYTVTVTDTNGCTTVANATVAQPLALSLSVSVTDASCPGAADGAATLAAGGGTPPYTVAWPNGATSFAVTNLSAGSYNPVVVDANGCSTTGTVQIDEPVPPVVEISGSDTTCVDVPDVFSLPANLSGITWTTGNNGTIVQGQGSAQASISWPATGVNTLSVSYIWGQNCSGTAQFTVYTDICVSTKDVTLPGVHVQPNPFGPRLTVLFDRQVQAGALLRLTDARGRLILQQNTLTETTQLETEGLPSGAYFLQIVENGRTGVWKLLKLD